MVLITLYCKRARFFFRTFWKRSLLAGNRVFLSVELTNDAYIRLLWGIFRTMEVTLKYFWASKGGGLHWKIHGIFFLEVKKNLIFFCGTVFYYCINTKFEFKLLVVFNCSFSFIINNFDNIKNTVRNGQCNKPTAVHVVLHAHI